MDRRVAVGILVAVFVGAIALVGIAFANRAADAGALGPRPVRAPGRFPGQGLTRPCSASCSTAWTVPRASSARRGRSSCCRSPRVRRPTSPGTTRRSSARAGLLGAIDDAEQRGSLNGVVAAILRPIVERAPVQWLIDGGQGIAGLFD